MKKDEEYWGMKVINAVKGGLNTAITAINSEKNDGLTLDPVNARAYFYSHFGNDMPNDIPCVIFDIQTEMGQTTGGTSSERFSIMVQLVVSDKLMASNENTFKVLARYRRAVKDVIAPVFANYHGLSIVSLPHARFDVGSLVFHTVGVGVEFEFAN
jgi:hypothetical protein